MRDPGDYAAAMALLIDKEFTTTPTFREQQTRANFEGCDERLVQWAHAFVRDARRRGIPLFVHSAYRTFEEQEELYALGKGVTTVRGGNSAHNHGKAVDVIHGVYGWDIAETHEGQKKVWDIIGLIGREVARRMSLKLTWGGEWSAPWDPAHWEIKDWRTQI